MKRMLSVLGGVLLGVGVASAAVVGRDVEYKAGDVTCKGFLAYDDATAGPAPGVLVVHEWWGHNEYARNRARMLAGLGYVALAVDMYGDGKTAGHPDEAGAFADIIRKDAPLARARFDAAKQFLTSQPRVDSKRIAAIGYCFGGGVVLNMARAGEDLAGVVSFHGSVVPTLTAAPGSIKARILVCHGEKDPFVTAEQMAAFKEEMKVAGADYRIEIYPDAVHSFTNPAADDLGKKFNLPLHYNEAADHKSWSDMQAFLQEVFVRK